MPSTLTFPIFWRLVVPNPGIGLYTSDLTPPAGSKSLLRLPFDGTGVIPLIQGVEAAATGGVTVDAPKQNDLLLVLNQYAALPPSILARMRLVIDADAGLVLGSPSVLRAFSMDPQGLSLVPPTGFTAGYSKEANGHAHLDFAYSVTSGLRLSSSEALRTLFHGQPGFAMFGVAKRTGETTANNAGAILSITAEAVSGSAQRQVGSLYITNAATPLIGGNAMRSQSTTATTSANIALPTPRQFEAVLSNANGAPANLPDGTAVAPFLNVYVNGGTSEGKPNATAAFSAGNLNWLGPLSVEMGFVVNTSGRGAIATGLAGIISGPLVEAEVAAMNAFLMARRAQLNG